MKYIFYILIFSFHFLISSVQAKPMCEVLYDRIYNEADYYDVSIPTVENQKTIGIRLLKYWNTTKYQSNNNTRGGYDLKKIKMVII